MGSSYKTTLILKAVRFPIKIMGYWGQRSEHIAYMKIKYTILAPCSHHGWEFFGLFGYIYMLNLTIKQYAVSS